MSRRSKLPNQFVFEYAAFDQAALGALGFEHKNANGRASLLD
jgi:hypothetical protein